MKKMIITAIALVLSVSTASLTFAQDDIYYSKSSKKVSTKAIYAETSGDVWSSDINDDWDIDAYNRRGTAMETATASNTSAITEIKADDITKLSTQPQVVHDTVILNVTEINIDPFYWSSRIHRFHNRLFSYYAYSPYYFGPAAYYDPWYYWDWAFYDPWYWDMSWSWSWGWGGFYWGHPWGYYSWWHPHYYAPCYHWSYAHHHNHHIHNGGHYRGHHFDRLPNRNNGHLASGSVSGMTRSRNRAAVGNTRVGGYASPSASRADSRNNFSLRGGSNRANASGRDNRNGVSSYSRPTRSGSSATRSNGTGSSYNSNRSSLNTSRQNGTVRANRESRSTTRTQSSNSNYSSGNSSNRSSSSSRSSYSSGSSFSSGSRSGGSSFSGGGSHYSGGSRGGGGRR